MGTHNVLRNPDGARFSMLNASGAFRCNDEYDFMDYRDSVQSSILRHVCPNPAEDLTQLDCGCQDCSAIKSPAGRFLASYWTPANNQSWFGDIVRPSPDATTQEKDKHDRMGKTRHRGRQRRQVSSLPTMLRCGTLRERGEARRMTVGLRIVIGHDPLFYREALAEALRCLCPDLDIVLADSSDVDKHVACDGARVLVICSALSSIILECSLGWVLLYPDGENRALVCLRDQQWPTDGFTVANLLALIDDAQRLVELDI